jgi:hypothetical protein
VPADQSPLLLCHPATPCPAVRRLAVDLAWLADGALALTYRLQGDLDRLRWPAGPGAGFADGLWQHSCCELFVGLAGEPAYREFNFSPAGQWAAYAFSGYRQRAAFVLPDAAPLISVSSLDDRLAMAVRLAPAFLPPAAPGATFELGLSAVVEAADGALAYWALAHPAERPDFHRREAFALHLTAPFPKVTHAPSR